MRAYCNANFANPFERVIYLRNGGRENLKILEDAD